MLDVCLNIGVAVTLAMFISVVVAFRGRSRLDPLPTIGEVAKIFGLILVVEGLFVALYLLTVIAFII